MTPTEHPCYHSPKRKREPSESDFYSPSASPTSTVSVASFPEARLREDTDPGRHSPRAAVAGRFGQLAIRGERLLGHTPSEHSEQGISQEYKQAVEKPCIEKHDHDSGTMSKPLQLDHIEGYLQPSPPVLRDAPTTPTKSPSRRKIIPSPRKQEGEEEDKEKDPASPSPSRKQQLSPPPTEDNSSDPFTWHDDEITGHNPSDPTDDGYGINGVGFKPTAAMAWARSQKRQKQVAEWKTREAREARERRRERRNDGMNIDTIRNIHNGAIQKRVKFDV